MAGDPDSQAWLDHLFTVHGDGQLSVFYSSEGFDSYHKRLQAYYQANDINSSVEKKALLLQYCGSEAYKHLRDSCAPEIPYEKAYEELITLLKYNYVNKPTRNICVYNFHKRTRKIGEDISSYIETLKELSKLCEYGEYEDERLRDQFVVGINSESIQMKFFLAPHNLDFTECCNIALEMEANAKTADKVRETAKDIHVAQLRLLVRCKLYSRTFTGQCQDTRFLSKSANNDSPHE